jgi:hypothetical protein
MPGHTGRQHLGEAGWVTECSMGKGSRVHVWGEGVCEWIGWRGRIGGVGGGVGQGVGELEGG